MSTKLCLIQYAECMNNEYIMLRSGMLYGAVMTGCLDLVLCLSPISSLRPIVQHRSVFKDIQIPDYFPDLSKLSQRMKFFSIYRDDRY